MQIFWQKVLQKMRKSYFFGGMGARWANMIPKNYCSLNDERKMNREDWS